VNQGWLLEISSEYPEDADDQFSVNVDQFVHFPIVGRMLIWCDENLFIEAFSRLLDPRM
jgi:hypothetical protein